jgi:hypothetical protein
VEASLTNLLLSILIVAALAVDDVDLRYNPAAERIFEGTAASAGDVVNSVVFFPLMVEDRMIEVELGPKEFVGKSGFKMKAGEIVTVIGMSRVAGKRETVLAREVRTIRHALILRDRNGVPVWDSSRPVQMDTEFAEDTLCEMIMP